MDDLVSSRNNLFHTSNLYSFHTLPEEAVALMTMGAQLRSMKISDTHPDKKIRGMSLWDLYHVQQKTNEDGTTEPEIVFGYKEKDGTITPVIRGYERASNVVGDTAEMKEVSELTTKEWRRLKYIYKRIHGGYREDERTYLEYFVLGQLFVQFKRYLPNILRNIWQSRGPNLAMGYYTETGDTYEGKPVMQWNAQIMEGRWRVLGKWFLTTIGALDLLEKAGASSWGGELGLYVGDRTRAYAWRNLGPQQRAEIYEAFTTAAFWSLMWAGKMFLFGADGDEDDSIQKVYTRIHRDLTQHYNFMELSTNLLVQPVPIALQRTGNTITGTLQFVTGYMTHGSTAGISDVFRSIPLMAWWKRIVDHYQYQDWFDIAFIEYMEQRAPVGARSWSRQ